MSHPVILAPQEQQVLADIGEGRWLDLWVFFDPETATLEAQMPDMAIPVGWPVRWRFRSRTSGGAIGPLPEGWSPMLAFDVVDESDPSPFGPFESLLQWVQEDSTGGSLVDLIGEWPGGCSPLPATKDFPYFAMLHRGVGFDNGKAFSLLSTSRQTLSLKAAEVAGTLYHRPLPPQRHAVELTVGLSSVDEYRLVLTPEKTVSAFTDSAVHWRFDLELFRMYPFILFYHSELKAGPGCRVSFEASTKNDHFLPCRRMRVHRTGVDAWDFKKDEKRHCFYEAAALSSRALSLQMFSTGDPQLDNEGIPFNE